MELNDIYPLTLLALCVWREARGETITGKTAVACSIRNRVNRPGWWGRSYESVVLMPWQYSSFNHNDPNAVKLPHSNDPSWTDSLTTAFGVWSGAIADITSGADSYFDRSLDDKPPSWATDGSKVKTCDIGHLHFYKTN